MTSVLVVDDREVDRELLGILLSQAGYLVLEATSTEEALVVARSERPDLVITDILMPGMNGYELVRKLRSLSDTDGIPVIFCRANHAERETIVGRVSEVVGPSLAFSPPQVGDRVETDRLRILNDKLVQKVAELESENTERRTLLGQLINAHEEERQRLAEDLHDESIQAVVALRMRLETLMARTTEPDLTRELDGLREQAAEAVERLRTVLTNIQPEEPDRSGLGVALRVLLEQASVEDGLECSLEDLTTRRPGQTVRSLLFRVGREALANIRHHAQASHVEMRLQDDSSGFTLVVRDDGKGFDARDGLRGRPGHLGLPAIRERVELSGGRLKLESGPDTGTEVQVWLPELESSNGRGPS